MVLQKVYPVIDPWILIDSKVHEYRRIRKTESGYSFEHAFKIYEVEEGDKWYDIIKYSYSKCGHLDNYICSVVVDELENIIKFKDHIEIIVIEDEEISLIINLKSIYRYKIKNPILNLLLANYENIYNTDQADLAIPIIYNINDRRKKAINR